MHDIWERIAKTVHQGFRGDPPFEAEHLAEHCGLTVREWGFRGGMRDGRTVYVPRDVPRERRNGLIAHEIGHWALVANGAPNTEDGARYLSGALMLPRELYARDADAAHWDLYRLKRRHRNVSFAMLAHRLAQTRPARIEIEDNGELRVALGGVVRGPMRLYHVNSRGYRRVIRVGYCP